MIYSYDFFSCRQKNGVFGEAWTLEVDFGARLENTDI